MDRTDTCKAYCRRIVQTQAGHHWFLFHLPARKRVELHSPEYLDDLEKSDPIAMRDKMLKTYAEICIDCDEEMQAPQMWIGIMFSLRLIHM